MGVGQFAGYPITAEVYVHNPCVPYSTGFRKAVRCILHIFPEISTVSGSKVVLTISKDILWIAGTQYKSVREGRRQVKDSCIIRKP
jgi:hypothetical protein